MKNTGSFFSFFSIASILLAFAALAGCGRGGYHVPPFGSTNELVVAMVNGPSSFFEDAQGSYSGLEYDLVSLFADQHGLKVKFVPMQDPTKAERALHRREVHFAATGMPMKPGDGLLSGPAYLRVEPQIVCNSGKTLPKNFADLAGRKIPYAQGSGISQALPAPLASGPSFAAIKMSSADEIVGQVSDGEIDCAAVLSNQVDIAKTFHPNIATAFRFGEQLPIAWMLPPGDQALVKSIEEFFAQIQKDGTLERLIDRYYGHIDRLDQADIVTFLEKMNTELSHFRPFFEEAGDLTGFDWRLLAALAYQESHWNEHATSPTGVRGMMMLTTETADRLKVENRLEARASILAGARYLAMLRDELPDGIIDSDRIWAALAAYNLGTAHIGDAMTLAKRLKLNPNTWFGLKQALPLLSESRYFRGLDHGFARGGEAVILVGNVSSYYDILKKFKPPQDIYRLK